MSHQSLYQLPYPLYKQILIKIVENRLSSLAIDSTDMQHQLRIYQCVRILTREEQISVTTLTSFHFFSKPWLKTGAWHRCTRRSTRWRRWRCQRRTMRCTARSSKRSWRPSGRSFSEYSLKTRKWLRSWSTSSCMRTYSCCWAFHMRCCSDACLRVYIYSCRSKNISDGFES